MRVADGARSLRPNPCTPIRSPCCQCNAIAVQNAQYFGVRKKGKCREELVEGKRRSDSGALTSWQEFRPLLWPLVFDEEVSIFGQEGFLSGLAVGEQEVGYVVVVVVVVVVVLIV